MAAAAVVASAARWLLGLWLADGWALLVLNVAGCAVLGWAGAGGVVPRVWLGVGLCGSLTSMSALALLVAEQLRDGSVAVAAGWLAVNVVGCAAAFVVAGWRRGQLAGGSVEGAS